MEKTKNLPCTDYAPAELDESSRLLLRAANLIESNGFACGGAFEQHTGELCARGALYKAAMGDAWAGYLGNDGRWDEAQKRLLSALGGSEPTDIGKWNNNSNKEAVIAKLRSVALTYSDGKNG